MNKYTISDCKLIYLTKFQERDNGSLSFVENQNQIPYDIKRVFFLYDIPGGESRGAHAHLKCHQFLVAVSGSFGVEVDDGNRQFKHYLNRPDFGLLVPCGIWASEVDFSSGATCLVLASDKFSENDYIRDYDKFLNLKNEV